MCFPSLSTFTPKVILKYCLFLGCGNVAFEIKEFIPKAFLITTKISFFLTAVLFVNVHMGTHINTHVTSDWILYVDNGCDQIIITTGIKETISCYSWDQFLCICH